MALSVFLGLQAGSSRLSEIHHFALFLTGSSVEHLCFQHLTSEGRCLFLIHCVISLKKISVFQYFFNFVFLCVKLHICG